MLMFPILAVFIGFGLVWNFSHGVEADEAFARYMAIAVLAGLDTVLGGLRARLSNQFDDTVFVSGFFVNTLLAAGLVALGERMGLETGVGEGRISVMMIAAVVVFSGRIFNNLAALRRMFIDSWRGKLDAKRAVDASRVGPAAAAPGEVVRANKG